MLIKTKSPANIQKFGRDFLNLLNFNILTLKTLVFRGIKNICIFSNGENPALFQLKYVNFFLAFLF
ncbi:hypothetical protein C7S20_09910 [Christiangramia fulva]|uniref:Uncharacterized protein n=1 Tax=Christiangramia fulva TaxID=2126553 RepID=A0A2R3Z5K0_9FLAO|nr:hypothetical protein C7S20_09910 [Christiangramia fulva]